MTMEGLDLIPLESNLHKFNPVIISQIINMIESDNFWHCKTFLISHEQPLEHVGGRNPRIGKCTDALYK